MNKIYKDAKDVPVAATIIYAAYVPQPDSEDLIFAFKDAEHTTKFSKEELLDAFLKGCLVVFDDLGDGYLKPCQIITSTHQSGYYTITVTYVDPADEPNFSLNHCFVQSAVDET